MSYLRLEHQCSSWDSHTLVTFVSHFLSITLPTYLACCFSIHYQYQLECSSALGTDGGHGAEPCGAWWGASGRGKPAGLPASLCQLSEACTGGAGGGMRWATPALGLLTICSTKPRLVSLGVSVVRFLWGVGGCKLRGSKVPLDRGSAVGVFGARGGL